MRALPRIFPPAALVAAAATAILSLSPDRAIGSAHAVDDAAERYPPVRVRAADGSVRIEDAAAGFRYHQAVGASVPGNPLLRSGISEYSVGPASGWVPFRTTLVNVGPDVSGFVTLREDTWMPAASYRHPVTIEGGQRLRVTFPVLADSGESWVVGFEDASGDELHRLVLRPRDLLPANARLALIATPPSGDSISHLTFDAGRRTVLAMRATDLPRSPLPYAGVELIALEDPNLDEEQQRALLAFVADGGVLVVATAVEIRGPLQTLMPADLGAVESVRALRTLDYVPGGPCPIVEPVAVRRLERRMGAVVWNRDESVVVHRRHGAGVVVQLGFPLTAEFLRGWGGAPHWQGAPQFMNMLAAASSPGSLGLPAPGAPSTLRAGLVAAIRMAMVKAIPPFERVVSVTGVYALAVLLLPLVASRALRRPEWAWAGVLGVAGAGSWVVHGIGTAYLEDNSSAIEVSLVSGGRTAGPHLSRSYWGLFSAQGEPLDLSFDGAPQAYPFGDEVGRERTTLQIGVGDDIQIRDLATHFQDSVTFGTTGVVDLPGGLEFTAECDGDNRTGSFRVPDGFPLIDAWVLMGGRAVRVVPGRWSFAGTAPDAAPVAAAEGEPGASAGLELLAYSVRTELARTLARDNEAMTPALLYRYDRPSSLAAGSVVRRGLHFGLLAPELVVPLPGEPPARTRGAHHLDCRAPKPDFLGARRFVVLADDFDAAGSLAHGGSWDLTGKGITKFAGPRSGGSPRDLKLSLKSARNELASATMPLPRLPAGDVVIDVIGDGELYRDRYDLRLGSGDRVVASVGVAGGYFHSSAGNRGVRSGYEAHRLTIVATPGRYELYGDRVHLGTTPRGTESLDWIRLDASTGTSGSVLFDDLQVRVGPSPPLSTVAFDFAEGGGWYTAGHSYGPDSGGRRSTSLIGHLDDEEWVAGGLGFSRGAKLALPITAMYPHGIARNGEGTIQLRVRFDELPEAGVQDILRAPGGAGPAAAVLRLDGDRRELVAEIRSGEDLEVVLTSLSLPFEHVAAGRWHTARLSWRSDDIASLWIDGARVEAPLRGSFAAGSRTVPWTLGGSAGETPAPHHVDFTIAELAISRQGGL